MKQLNLNENMVKELLSALSEMPAKYSMNLIVDIQKLFADQNKEEKDDTTDGQ